MNIEFTDNAALAEAVANSATTYRINSVTELQATAEAGCLYVFLNMSIMQDEVELESFDAMHVYRTSDPYGITPLIAQWLLDNPEFPITPYVPPEPPTLEEIRAAMPPLQRLDFKNRFKAAGMNLAKINAYFASIEGDESHWEDMQNYYAETLTFTRLSVFVVELAQFSAKTPEQIDAIWMA